MFLLMAPPGVHLLLYTQSALSSFSATFLLQQTSHCYWSTHRSTQNGIYKNSATYDTHTIKELYCLHENFNDRFDSYKALISWCHYVSVGAQWTNINHVCKLWPFFCYWSSVISDQWSVTDWGICCSVLSNTASANSAHKVFFSVMMENKKSYRVYNVLMMKLSERQI